MGSQVVNSVPAPRLRNSGGAPPPGFSMMSSATPPQMKPDVKRRHDVGNTREHDDQAVQSADRGAGEQAPPPPAPATAPKLAFSIVLAASTLATAITDPIERSMPPEITTTVCAAAAKASGSAPIASDCKSKSENSG